MRFDYDIPYFPNTFPHFGSSNLGKHPCQESSHGPHSKVGIDFKRGNIDTGPLKGIYRYRAIQWEGYTI